MHLISGCLHSTPVSWLPVLANVASPSLRHKAASDKMLQIIEAHPDWPAYADVFQRSPPWLASRRLIWSDKTHVDTIAHCKEDWQSAPVVNYTIVTHLAAWFRSILSVMVSAEPFSDRSRPMHNSSQIGPCQITNMRL